MSKKRQIQRAQKRQQRPARKPPPSRSIGDGQGMPARMVRLEAARRSRHARARPDLRSRSRQRTRRQRELQDQSSKRRRSRSDRHRPRCVSQNAAPPDGQVVHALEHGDIAIWYRQGATPEVVEALRKLNDNRPDDVLILPRPSGQGSRGGGWLAQASALRPTRSGVVVPVHRSLRR